MKKQSICIIGGGGHVGFPLGLMLASKGNKVYFYEKNLNICNIINGGNAPYYEVNAKKYINKYKKRYIAGFNNDYIKKADVIIICVGTPVNKNSSPKLKQFYSMINDLKKNINKNQLIIVRSSVYPGTIERVKKILDRKNENISYCPERILQGSALIELPKLPQILSGTNNKSIIMAKNFFLQFTKKIIITSTLEAELIKLFSNALRYINFATSNEFYMICKKLNVSFSNVRKKMMFGYSRNNNLSLPGFAAGPCLVKDTMQLNNLSNKNFNLGKSALSINGKFPNFLVNELQKKYNLKNKTIGILGLAFKSDVDDIRDSLSIKLIKILIKKKIKHVFSDEYYKHDKGISKKTLLKRSDIIIIAVPHKQYKNVKIKKNKILIDTWGIISK